MRLFVRLGMLGTPLNRQLIAHEEARAAHGADHGDVALAARVSRAGALTAARAGTSLFAIGLGVRLLGLLLLWMGNGSPLWWRKSIVVVGVMLSIGGITVLRYMLLSEPLARLGRRIRASS